MSPEDTDADDAGVIARSRREPALFAAIFDRHARHIHRYLVRRLGQVVADDVLAETFLIAFGKRGKYDRPWLHGIATNLAARHRRTEVRELRLRLAVGPPAPEARAPAKSVPCSLGQGRPGEDCVRLGFHRRVWGIGAVGGPE
jgi:DNA-directed RNA polymerase specialized sigma24 family protein